MVPVTLSVASLAIDSYCSDQSLSNSATATSFDKAAVYRATIAPLDHPAIVRTETSEIPLRRT
jgi:hypothetical protein